MKFNIKTRNETPPENQYVNQYVDPIMKKAAKRDWYQANPNTPHPLFAGSRTHAPGLSQAEWDRRVEDISFKDSAPLAPRYKPTGKTARQIGGLNEDLFESYKRQEGPFGEKLRGVSKDLGPALIDNFGYWKGRLAKGLMSEEQEFKLLRGALGLNSAGYAYGMDKALKYLDDNDVSLTGAFRNPHKGAMRDISAHAYNEFIEDRRAKTVDTPLADKPTRESEYFKGKWYDKEKFEDPSNTVKYFSALGESKLLPSSYFSTDGSPTSEGIDWIERTNEQRAGWNKTQDERVYKPLKF